MQQATGAPAGSGREPPFQDAREQGEEGPAAQAAALPPARQATTAPPPPLSRAQLAFWLPLACVQPVCVALLGVLTRYLQLETQPTWPPLRLISVMILLCAPLTLCLHLAMHWQAWWHQGRAQQLEQHGSGTSRSSSGCVDVEKAAAKGLHKQPPPGSTPERSSAPAGSWRCRHPRLYRTYAACAISLAQSVVLVFMIIAPRLVDASVSK